MNRQFVILLFRKQFEIRGHVVPLLWRYKAFALRVREFQNVAGILLKGFMKIESFFPGRLRVSSPLFTRSEAFARIIEYVEGIEGIRDVSGNLRTGSITVLYDPERITTPMLMSAKEEIENLESESVTRFSNVTEI